MKSLKWGPFGLFETPVCWKMRKKIEGGLFGDFKKFENKQDIFEQCHSAKKCERETLWDFLTSILLQDIETNEGAPFGAIQKFSKKVS